MNFRFLTGWIGVLYILKTTISGDMLLRRYLLILQSLIFFIPVDIYVIGDWLGAGIQWALVRYQQTAFGNSIIGVTQELLYIFGGNIQGRSAASLIVWDIGLFLLLLSFVILLIEQVRFSESGIRVAGLFTMSGGLLFGLYGVLQYGVSFHGPAGFCIPIGIPVIVLTGFFIYSEKFRYRILDIRGCHELVYPEGSGNDPATERSHYREIPDKISLILVLLVITQIMCLFTITNNVDQLHFDTSLYEKYGGYLVKGDIPYADFFVEYPQLFFIPVIIASLPSFFSLDAFYPVFIVLMIILDIGILLLVYHITQEVFGRVRAYLCSLLYVTAFSPAVFTFLTYDIFPTFLMVLSLAFFIGKKESRAWIIATLGGLAKWFPFLLLPFYTIHEVKNRIDGKLLMREIILSVLTVFLVTVPFLLLNIPLFMRTYTAHLSRPAHANSLIFYLDAICRQFFNMEFFDKISIALFLFCVSILACWYYFRGGKDPITLLYVIFFSIFIFVVLNKVYSAQYLVWFTPFLAIFLSNSLREIILFYIIQLICILEYPLLFRIIYSPNIRYSVLENAQVSPAFIFFTVKFFVLLITFFVIANQLKQHGKRNGNMA
jgi:hypothetical protein